MRRRSRSKHNRSVPRSKNCSRALAVAVSTSALGAAVPAASATAAPRDAPAPAEAEGRQLTVMFCDLVGSTALAAKLPPDLRQLVEAELQREPSLSWDIAVTNVLPPLTQGSRRRKAADMPHRTSVSDPLSSWRGPKPGSTRSPRPGGNAPIADRCGHLSNPYKPNIPRQRYTPRPIQEIRPAILRSDECGLRGR
jgi:hypothetical protein